MKEQTFILENYKDFEPKHIFECGQCFRWNIQDDESYTGVFGENILNVKKQDNKIIFKGCLKDNIIKTIIDYFDLDTDYSKIKKELKQIDEYMEKSIAYGSGIRILNQDLWETIISFIISANNNIQNIKKIWEGIKLEWRKILFFSNSRRIIKSKC